MAGIVPGQPVQLLKPLLDTKSKEFDDGVHILNFEQTLDVHARSSNLLILYDFIQRLLRFYCQGQIIEPICVFSTLIQPVQKSINMMRPRLKSFLWIDLSVILGVGKFQNNKLMLKFTAELSQQFRRASSVSSLKAYHISKSATKPKWPNFSIQKPPTVVTHHHPRMYEPPKLNGYETCHHQFHRPNHRPTLTCDVPIKSQMHSRPYPTCTQQKSLNSTMNRAQHWKTPKRAGQVKNIYLKQTNTRSANNFTHNYQTEKTPQVTLEPQPCLTQLNHNQIQLNESKIRSTVNSLRPHDTENEHTVRKASFLEKANNAAKMRISSINSLENIQKRIQATLGYQNQLKI